MSKQKQELILEGPTGFPNISRLNLHSEPLTSSLEFDLFGVSPPLATGFLPPAERCEGCGQTFTQRSGQGRPWRYCSPACRRVAKLRMSREWNAADHAKQSEYSCRCCGEPIRAAPRTSGRAPHYCSARCKRRFRFHGPDTAVQFPFILTNAKEKS